MLIRAGHTVYADYGVSCGYVHMRLQFSAYAHIFFNMRKSTPFQSEDITKVVCNF